MMKRRIEYCGLRDTDAEDLGGGTDAPQIVGVVQWRKIDTLLDRFNNMG
jgi:hypothetical protein